MPVLTFIFDLAAKLHIVFYLLFIQADYKLFPIQKREFKQEIHDTVMSNFRIRVVLVLSLTLVLTQKRPRLFETNRQIQDRGYAERVKQ